MERNTFYKRRGIKPYDKKVVRASKYTLDFWTPGMPYVEPCFASVHEIDDSDLDKTGKGPMPLVGVAYLVDHKDFAKIVQSEGAGIGYKMVEIEAETVVADVEGGENENPEKLSVWTLVIRKPRKANECSQRYKKLLIDGAQQNNLPQDYQTMLHLLPHYQNRSIGQKIGRIVFILLFGPTVLAINKLEKIFVDDEGTAPHWLALFVNIFVRSMWVLHDNVTQYFFGPGNASAPQI